MATNIYVGNLSYDTTEDTLRTLFAEYGEVEAVRVITDRYTGRSKGFGFVEIATEEAAQEAIGALNGKSVDGREIRVDKAKPRADRDRPRW
ncbi:MAG: RNA-binding protein [Anaerolineae bacterium]|jgi:RNA recognition motif-containing protein